MKCPFCEDYCMICRACEGDEEALEELHSLISEDQDQSSGKEEAYEDRNLAVLAYLKSQHELVGEVEYTASEITDLQWSEAPEIGWKEAPDSSDDWVIVWIEDQTGQKSWHVPRDLVEDLDWLEQKHVDWDGHSRKEKNQRIKDFVGISDA